MTADVTRAAILAAIVEELEDCPCDGFSQLRCPTRYPETLSSWCRGCLLAAAASLLREQGEALAAAFKAGYWSWPTARIDQPLCESVLEKALSDYLQEQSGAK